MGGANQTAHVLIPKGATVYYTRTVTSGNGGSGWANIGNDQYGTSSSNTLTETDSFTVSSESMITIQVGGSGGQNAGGSGTIKITKVVNASGKQCILEIRDVYSVTYDLKGKGTGAPGLQYKPKDINITLSSTKPTRTNFTFKGWATSATATTASYQPGAAYTGNSNLTLYAVWQTVDASRTIVFSNGVSNGVSGGGQSGNSISSTATLPANVIVYYTLTASQTNGGGGSSSISFAGTAKDSVSSSSTSGQTVTKSGRFNNKTSGT